MKQHLGRQNINLVTGKAKQLCMANDGSPPESHTLRMATQWCQGSWKFLYSYLNQLFREPGEKTSMLFS